MKVLVVDDEEMVRNSLKVLLATLELEIATAANDQQALEIAAHYQPDLAIIDRNLGAELDGLAVADALLIVQPSISIVIVSGDPAGQRQLEQDYPTYKFLAKPFRLAELLDLLPGKGDQA